MGETRRFYQPVAFNDTVTFGTNPAPVSFADNVKLLLGTDSDVALVERSTALNANTTLSGVIVGTPVTPAVAANSFILGNVTADGDLLLVGQTGGNSHAVFFADLSAGTTSIMVAGVATARFDSTDVLFPDDYILSIGTGTSIAYKDDATNANTAVTNVILGTPVTPALAADTLIVSNQIADGDILIATQTGGNTQAAIFVDASANTMDLMAAGVRIARISSAGITAGLAGTTLGKVLFSGNTSGVITMNGAAAAGTWTFTLPPDDGDAGEQLQTDGSGVTTWEAAGSLRAFKHVGDRVDQALGLSRLLDTPVYAWRYRRPSESPVRVTTTGDFENEYVGPMAEDAPWAMHHGKRIFDPVSAFGHTVLAIQALAARIEALEA